MLRIAFALVFTALAGLSPAKALTLVTGNEYAPYTDENLPGGGLATQMVRRIVEEMGVDVEISFRPWARGFTLTERAEFDGTFPYISNPERRGNFWFSEPLFSTYSVVYMRKDMRDGFVGEQSVAGGRICQPVGYGFSDIVSNMAEEGKVTVIKVNELPTCFRQLKAEKLDYVLIGKRTGLVALRQAGLNPANFADAPVSRQNESAHFLLISRKHAKGPELIRNFNTAMKRLREKGLLKRLEQEFFATYPIN